MEVFSAVAAGIALSAQLMKLGRSLHKAIEKIKYTRPEIAKLAAELDIFSGLYDQFMNVCVFEPNAKYCNAAPTRRLVAWAQEARNAIRKLLDRVTGSPGDSIVEKVAARVQWFFSEHEVKCLRLSLRVARESMIGFTNIGVIQKLDEQMAMLRAASANGTRQAIEQQLGISLKARIKMLKKWRTNCRAQRHAINSRLQEAKLELFEHSELKSYNSDIIPEPKRLLRFTSSVEAYVEKTMPLGEPGRESTYVPSTTKHRSVRADSAQPPPSSSTSYPFTPSASGSPGSPGSDGSYGLSGSSSLSVSSAPPAPPANDYDDILNYCNICSGTCLRAQEHGFSYPSVVSVPTSRDVEDVMEHLDQHSVLSRSERTSREQIVREKSPPLTPSRGQRLDKTVSQAGSNGIGEHKEVRHDDNEAMGAYDDVSSLGVELEREGTLEDRFALYEDVSSMSEEEEEEAVGDATNPSPFHPVAGVEGSFPPGWRTRHERSESPQDFWHRKL